MFTIKESDYQGMPTIKQNKQIKKRQHFLCVLCQNTGRWSKGYSRGCQYLSPNIFFRKSGSATHFHLALRIIVQKI